MKNKLIAGISAVIFSLAIGVIQTEPVDAAVNQDLFVVAGHRGAMGEAAQQTLAGFDRAVSEGVDALEFDIQFTADNVMVISHNSTTGEIFNQNLNIRNSTLAQLRRLRYKASPYETIHTVEEIFQRYHSNPTLGYVLELKTVVQNQERMLINLINKYGLASRVIVESFQPLSLSRVKQIAPNILTLQLTASQPTLTDYLRESHDEFFGIPDTMATANNLSLISSFRKKIMAWDISANGSDLSSASVASLPIQGGIVNFPAQAKQALEGSISVNAARQNVNQQVVHVNTHEDIWLWNNPENPTVRTQKIAGNTNWRVTAMKLVDGVIWYQLATNAWVNGKYTGSQTPTLTNVPKVVKVTTRGTAWLFSDPVNPNVHVSTVNGGSNFKVVSYKLIDGLYWYDLGCNEWISSQYVVPTSFGEKINSTPTEVTIITKPVNRQTKITSKILKVHVPSEIWIWSNPTTNATHVKSVSLNSRWKIVTTHKVGNTTWYNLGRNEWINGQYAVVESDNVLRATKDTGVVLWSDSTVLTTKKQVVSFSSSWKIVGTKNVNGMYWYNLGMNEWISGQYAQQVNSGVDTDAEAAEPTNKPAQTTEPEKTEPEISRPVAKKIVTIKNPTDIWLIGNPGVNPIHTNTVQYGTLWKIVEIKQVNGITWYNLGRNEWISSQNAQIVNFAGGKALKVVKPGQAWLWNNPTSPTQRTLSVNIGSQYIVGETKRAGGLTWYELGINNWISSREAE